MTCGVYLIRNTLKALLDDLLSSEAPGVIKTEDEGAFR